MIIQTRHRDKLSIKPDDVTSNKTVIFTVTSARTSNVTFQYIANENSQFHIFLIHSNVLPWKTSTPLRNTNRLSTTQYHTTLYKADLAVRAVLCLVSNSRNKGINWAQTLVCYVTITATVKILQMSIIINVLCLIWSVRQELSPCNSTTFLTLKSLN